LQKELQNFVTNNVFFDKKYKHNNNKKQKNQTLKTLARAGNWTQDSCTQSQCVTIAPPSQLRESIVAKLFNCFDAIGQNVNKQSRICGPHIFKKSSLFSVIFLHAWITIYTVLNNVLSCCVSG